MTYNLINTDLKRTHAFDFTKLFHWKEVPWSVDTDQKLAMTVPFVCARLMLGFLVGLKFLIDMVAYPTISTAWIAPFFEETFRFTIFAGPLLWFEIVSKFYLMFYHSSLGDFSKALVLVPSVVGHFIFFFSDISLQKRFLMHFLWNYYVMSQNTGAINYTLEQMNVFGVFRCGCMSINLYSSPLLRATRLKVAKARARYYYRRRLRARRARTRTAPVDLTPNMTLYRSFLSVRLNPQSYAEMASKPASKCKLIPLKCDPELLFKSRQEMRNEKKARAKNERFIRKALTKQAREISMRNRIIAAHEKSKRTGKWPVVDVNAIAPPPPKRSAEQTIKDQQDKAMLMLRWRDVMRELKYAPPLEPVVVLGEKQQKLVDLLLDSILRGKSKFKINRAMKRLHKSLDDESELKDSLSALMGINLEPQMFKTLSSFLPDAPNIPVTHSLHESDRATLDALITKFSGLTEKITDSPLLKGKATLSFDSKSVMTSIALIMGSIMVGYMIYQNPASAAGSALKALILSLVAYYAKPLLKSCVADAFKAFEGSGLPIEKPAPPSDGAVPLTPQGLGSTLYSIAGPLITWCHYTQSGELADKSLIKSFIETSTMAKKVQEAVVFNSSTLMTFLSEVFSWLGDSLGWTGLAHVFDLYPELTKIEKEVRDLEAQLHAGTIFPDRRMALQVAAYRNDVIKVVAKLKPGSAPAIRAGFLVKAIDVLYKTTAIGHAQNSVRAEPVCVNLYSPPGVGKSTLVQSMAHEFLAQPGILDKKTRAAFAAQRDNFVYCIDATQNYPDGYYSQLVTILDDWGIRKDKAGGEMDNGLTALIRWVNGMPYNVESAHLELKGKIFAANIIMLATTNCRRATPEEFPGFTEIGAVLRRLHLSYMLSIADEFCENPKLDYEHRKIRSDIVKYMQVKNPKTGVDENVQILPYEAWIFVPWDMSKGARAIGPDGVTLPIQDYDQVMATLVAKVKKARTFNAVHKTTIESRIAESLKLAAEQDARDAPLEPQMYSESGALSDPSIKEFCDEHKWVKPAFERYIASTCKGSEAKRKIVDKAEFLSYINELTTRDFDYDKVVSLLSAHPVDWCGFKNAHAADPTRTAVECFETDVKEKVAPFLERVSNVWQEVKDWVQTNPTLVALATLSMVAVFAIPFVYNWLSTSFFETESLQPKLNKEPVKGRAVLRTQLPKAAVKIDLKTESGCAVNLNDISNLVNNNRFEISLSDTKMRQCSAIGIYNRYLVMPRHMITEFLGASELNPELRMTFKRARAETGFTFSVSYQDMVDNDMLIDFPENHDKSEKDRFNDRIIVRVPETMMQNIPDIRKHLVSVHDKMWSSKVIKGTVNLVSTTPTGRMIEQFWDADFKVDNKIEHVEGLSIINGLFYSQETSRGDCGSPLYGASAGSAKIIGFHIAGNSSYRIAVGVAIRSEDFDFLIEEPKCEVRDIPLASQNLEGHLDNVSAAVTGRIIAKLEKPIYQPSKSTHVHAPFYNVLEPCNLARSVLTVKEVDGVVVNASHQGLKNYNRDRVMFPTSHFEEIGYSITTEAIASGCVGTRRLSYEEAIHGNDDMDGIPKDTSLGIPMIDWSTPCYKGKTIIMGRGEEKHGPRWDDCKAAYDEMRKQILEGKNPTLLMKAMVKDELLPKEKVAKANSRITFTAPFLLQVFSREQYGDMSMHIMKKDNIVINRQALGLNVYSEWDILANILLKYGSKRILDFDYRKYDGSLGRQILNLVFDIMDKLCPFSNEEDKKIKQWIRAQTLNAMVAHGDVVIEFDGSNTSGNSLTTIINNFANQILTMFVLSSFVLKQNGCKFESGLIDWKVLCANVRMCTLGDDVIMALGALFDDITTKDFAEILRPYNIDITNGDKTDPVENPKGLRGLDEVTFLKRSFRLEGGRYVAPLAMASICKMIQWKNKSVTDDEYQEIVRNALLEIAIHGKSVYDSCRAQMEPLMTEMRFSPHGKDWAADYHQALKLSHSWQG